MTCGMPHRSYALETMVIMFAIGTMMPCADARRWVARAAAAVTNLDAFEAVLEVMNDR